MFFTSCNTGYSHIKRYYRILDEQTVFVQTTETATAGDCHEAGLLPGEESQACQMILQTLPEVTGRFVGTGTFILYNDKIHVLTAEHVCSPNEFPKSITRDNFIIDVHLTTNIIVNSRNFEATAKVIKEHADHDLCLLELDKYPEDVRLAKVARKKPKRGAEVHYTGAPYGLMSDKFLLAFEGSYSGLINDNAMVFALPCAQGASGSSIRDRKNKIVSMVQRVHPSFGNICFGVATEHLKTFLTEE